MPYLLRTYSIFKLTLATTELRQRQAVDLDNDTIEKAKEEQKV
jgi:hypothetical protein